MLMMKFKMMMAMMIVMMVIMNFSSKVCLELEKPTGRKNSVRPIQVIIVMVVMVMVITVHAHLIQNTNTRGVVFDI